MCWGIGRFFTSWSFAGNCIDAGLDIVWGIVFLFIVIISIVIIAMMHHHYCHPGNDTNNFLSRTRVIYYDLSREFKKIEKAKVVFFSTIVTMIAGQYGSCPRYGGDVGGDRSPGIHQHPN